MLIVDSSSIPSPHLRFGSTTATKLAFCCLRQVGGTWRKQPWQLDTHTVDGLDGIIGLELSSLDCDLNMRSGSDSYWTWSWTLQSRLQPPFLPPSAHRWKRPTVSISQFTEYVSFFCCVFPRHFLEYSGARVPKINDIYTSTVQVVGIPWAASNQLLHLWVGFENFAAGVFLNLQPKNFRTCYCPFVHCE